MDKKFYSFENKTDSSADLYIFGDITSYEWDESDVSAWGFKKELDDLGEISELNVHINSYGGETFQGLAIYNQLKQHKAHINVYIDGIAASSASIIAMAGDKIYMPKTALMVIHNCWLWTVGNSKELRKTADDMDKIAVAYKEAYLSKVNITEENLDKLLDEETYLTADECIEMGFADEMIDLKTNSSINQNANMCLFKLVNKLKQQEQEKTVVINIDEKTVNKIVNDISNNLLNGYGNKEPSGLLNSLEKNNKVQKKDTLMVSFLNKFLNKKGRNFKWKI